MKNLDYLLAFSIALSLIFSSESKVYAQCSWTQKANFGPGNTTSATGFSVGSKGYIGTGYGTFWKKDLWEYDPATDSWSQKADFGGIARVDAVAFTIGSKGYIGTGRQNTTKFKDFWEYDPASNTWTQKAFFGGVERQTAVGFSIGNKGYIGTGSNNGQLQDFWEYDPAADAWTQKADFGGTARYGAVGFGIGTKGYLGTGIDPFDKNDFWEYDPATDTWTQKATFGGATRHYAVGFSMGSFGYISTGQKGATRYKDFWKYDPALDTWTQKFDFGGTQRESAVGFSIGSKAYIGTGGSGSQDFWEWYCIVPLSIMISDSTMVTCNGGNDGAATVSVTGGTPPYSYVWNTTPAQTDSIATGLSAGTYSVIITDAASSSDSVSITIIEPSLIFSSAGTAICSGDSIILAGGYQTSAGTYVDTLTASNGCDSVLSTTLTIDTISSTTLMYSICNGDSMFLGGAYQTMIGNYYDTLVASNGCDSVLTTVLAIDSIYTENISVSICDGDSILLGGMYQNTAGNYVDALTTSNGCDSVVTTYLSILFQSGMPDTICQNTYIATCDLLIDTLTVLSVDSLITDWDIYLNGTKIYEGYYDPSYTFNQGFFDWVTPAVRVFTPPLSVSVGDTISQIITGGTGCFILHTEMSSVVCNVSVAVSSTNTTCGNSDGSALATVSGGVPPYTYSWSSGDTLANADSLSAGNYVVDAWDVNGCNTIGIATISDAGGPNITTDNITDVTCYGDADGSISLTVSGGTTPYIYAWSSGDSIEDLTNLQAGPYDLQVTDAVGCVGTINILVNTPAALALSGALTNATCGNSDGAMAATVTGGTPPYSYLWSNGGTSSSITGIASGGYSVTVTDANACIDSSSGGVSELGGATIVIDSVVPAPCSGNGGIFISTSGGTAPFGYAWSNSVVTEDNPGVSAGIYGVTVTDSSGCMAVASIEVLAEALNPQQICMVTVDTIDLVNLVIWDKPSSTSIDFFNIYKESTVAGVYFLAGSVDYDSLSYFTDPNSNPKQRAWRYKMTAVDFCGNESGYGDIHKTMHISINEGLGNDFNLAWNHYEGFIYGSYYVHRYRPSEGWLLRDSLPSNLSSWTDFSVPQGKVDYIIEAKHPNGCLASKAKNWNSSKSNTSAIQVAGTMTSTTSSTNASLGICDGTATATPTGGTPPYTYLWNDSLAQTSATAIGLCPGSYNVIIVDAAGNTVVDTSLVGETLGASPVVDFLADSTVITEGDFVNFTDLSTNAPTSWIWSFTGGNPGSSFDQIPPYIQYNNAGSYEVSLLATN
ncbi:MAG: hypothetical protein JKX73_08065, partial [Flavobacteriales bacterium]|nr:hypothetical protein [Flavobacteriales bacterium]